MLNGQRKARSDTTNLIMILPMTAALCSLMPGVNMVAECALVIGCVHVPNIVEKIQQKYNLGAYAPLYKLEDMRAASQATYAGLQAFGKNRFITGWLTKNEIKCLDRRIAARKARTVGFSATQLPRRTAG